MNKKSIGYSFFVSTILTVLLTVSCVSSAPTRKSKQKEWPSNIVLDEQHWQNSCSHTNTTVGGKQDMAVSLNKTYLTAEGLENFFRNRKNNRINIHDDTSNLDHHYRHLPKLNQTKPLGRLFRELHRSAQIYVGLFDALYKYWEPIDRYSFNATNDTSQELYNYRTESKILLCELESTLNSTKSVRHIFNKKQMQVEIMKMTKYMDQKEPLLNNHDAMYVKKNFYKFVVELKNYLEKEIRQKNTNLKKKIRKNKNSSNNNPLRKSLLNENDKKKLNLNGLKNSNNDSDKKLYNKKLNQNKNRQRKSNNINNLNNSSTSEQMNNKNRMKKQRRIRKNLQQNRQLIN